jgi:hypothetical protein
MVEHRLELSVVGIAVGVSFATFALWTIGWRRPAGWAAAAIAACLAGYWVFRVLGLLRDNSRPELSRTVRSDEFFWTIDLRRPTAGAGLRPAGGSLRCTDRCGEGGGSWGNHGFPHA